MRGVPQRAGRRLPPALRRGTRRGGVGLRPQRGSLRRRAPILRARVHRALAGRAGALRGAAALLRRLRQPPPGVVASAWGDAGRSARRAVGGSGGRPGLRPRAARRAGRAGLLGRAGAWGCEPAVGRVRAAGSSMRLSLAARWSATAAKSRRRVSQAARRSSDRRIDPGTGGHDGRRLRVARMGVPILNPSRPIEVASRACDEGNCSPGKARPRSQGVSASAPRGHGRGRSPFESELDLRRRSGRREVVEARWAGRGARILRTIKPSLISAITLRLVKWCILVS